MSQDNLARKLAELDPHTERYRVLRCARDFKASWVSLAEALQSVEETHKHLEWGFESIEQYCEQELRLSPRTAQKLLKSYKFLSEHEPDTVQVRDLDPRDRPQVPDVAQVAFLAKARGDARVPEPVYRKLRDAAFRDGASVTELRSQYREAVPEPPKPRPARDEAKALKVALSHAARVIQVLSEVEGLEDEVMKVAERLRDAIAFRLPKEQA